VESVQLRQSDDRHHRDQKSSEGKPMQAEGEKRLGRRVRRILGGKGWGARRKQLPFGGEGLTMAARNAKRGNTVVLGGVGSRFNHKGK